jgi:hypothetical protein
VWYYYPPTEEEVDTSDVFMLTTWPAQDELNQKINFNGRTQNNCVHQDIAGTRIYTQTLISMRIGTRSYHKGSEPWHYAIPGSRIVDTWSNARYDFVCTYHFDNTVPPSFTGRYETTCYDRVTQKYLPAVSAKFRWTLKRADSYVVTPLPEITNPDNLLFSSRERIRLQEKVSEVNPKLDWGEMGLEACDSKRLLNINFPMYIRDFLTMPKLISSIAGNQVIRKISQGVDLRKVSVSEYLSLFANEYLANHYGTRLTFSDTVKISKALRALDIWHQYERVGDQKTADVGNLGAWNHVVCDRSLSAIVHSYSDMQLQTVDSIQESIDQLQSLIGRSAYDADLLLSKENLWDMVPYSFVVDWFLPIGDVFARQERIGYAHQFRPIVCFYSDHFRMDRHESFVTDSGTDVRYALESRLYIRQVRRFLPSPKLWVDPDRPGHLSGHWLEATALVVQALI